MMTGASACGILGIVMAAYLLGCHGKPTTAPPLDTVEGGLGWKDGGGAVAE